MKCNAISFVYILFCVFIRQVFTLNLKIADEFLFILVSGIWQQYDLPVPVLWSVVSF